MALFKINQFDEPDFVTAAVFKSPSNAKLTGLPTRALYRKGVKSVVMSLTPYAEKKYIILYIK